ncbi:MAG: trypsin-like peptidase domain-containing protein [Planctomycetaceae bacterium]|nr:trypsin-like peptidase domain-containing protein [Planctomycetaceae bacterium]
MTILLSLLGPYRTTLGKTLPGAIPSGLGNLPLVAACCIGLWSQAAWAAVEDAVVMVEGCSGVCVDPAGLVLTARHCDLPATVTVRFKDRAVSAQRVYVSHEAEGPVVYDCEGDGYPCLPIAATAPRVGERVWSCGYPHLNGRRELRWASGAVLRWSTFEYAGGAFNGNVVRFATAPGWSGGPLLNAKAEVCGLLNSSDRSTSVFISWAAVRQAYATVRQQLEQERPVNDGRATLYVFGSMTCSPCRQFQQNYANNATFCRQLESRFSVEFVDVDKQVELTSRFGVTEVPTFIIPDVVRITGYRGPDDLLVRLGIQPEIAARPPPLRDAGPDPVESAPPQTDGEAERPATVESPVIDPLATEPPAPTVPNEPPVATSPEITDRLDRLSGLVQTGVSIATWLGVGGMTGGAGGLILGGLALWRTLRRRRSPKPARDPPAKVTPPPIVTVDSPPPPQAIVPETRFAPYERDTFAEAFAWAETELVRKYPGAVSTLETLKGLIHQFLSAKGVKPTK